MPLELVLIASFCVSAPSLPDDVLGVLAPGERTALATAVDDRDHQEAAFSALFGAMARLEPGTIDPSLLESWTTDEVIAARDEPDAWRGRPVRLRGRLEQTRVLDPPWDGCVEWFVRLPDGEAVAVYLPREEDRESGRQVEVIARHYKRIKARARDGTERVWAAFVGRVGVAVPGSSSRGMLMAVIVVMLLAWFVLLILTRRVSKAGPSKPTPAEAPVPTPRSDLQDDPVAALDELARRHDDSIRKADQ